MDGVEQVAGEEKSSRKERPGRGERKVALVLGGGGARGVAHIGVLKVLQEEGVPIDLLVGTSIGALGAALYGLRPDWRWVRERVFAYLRKKGFTKYGMGLQDSAGGRRTRPLLSRIGAFLKKSIALNILLAKRSLVRTKRLREAIAGILPEGSFEETKIPVAVVALDMLSGEEVVISTGSLREAVVASASLVGFFPQVRRDGRLYADPSPVSSVPVDAARRLGATAVIAADVRSRVERAGDVRTGVDAILRVAALASERANDEQLARADVAVSPGVGRTFWSDFRDLDAHVEAGARAARDALPRIRELVEGKPATRPAGK